MRQFLSAPVVKLPYSPIYQLRGRLDLRDPTLLYPSSSSARVFDEIKKASSEWPRAHLDFSVDSITDDARVLHIYYGPCLMGLCRSRWPALASFFSSLFLWAWGVSSLTARSFFRPQRPRSILAGQALPNMASHLPWKVNNILYCSPLHPQACPSPIYSSDYD